MEELQFFLSNKPKDLSITIIGLGSNLLIRDKGIDGVVIRLGRNFTEISHNKDYLVAGGSCLSYNLSLYAMENSLGGFE